VTLARCRLWWLRHLLALAVIGPAIGAIDDFLHVVPPEDRQKFDKLAKPVDEQLSGVKVYKVGDEAEKRAYVVGKTKDGKWAGLRTTVVET